MKIKGLPTKSTFSKASRFPLYIFVGFMVFVVVIVAGVHFVRSQGEVLQASADQCDKTGINTAIPLLSLGDREFKLAQELGVKYILGIVYNSESEKSAVRSIPGYENEAHPVERVVAERINVAKEYDLEVVVRICDITNPCGFAPDNRSDTGAWKQKGEEYGEFLKEIAKRASVPFTAFGGHCEPNGDWLNEEAGGSTSGSGVNKIPPQYEKAFIDGMLSKGVSSDSNINLLSPQFDLHNPEFNFIDYVTQMGGPSIFNNFHSIAGATYGLDGDEDPIKKVEKAYGFFKKEIFVAETGMMDRNYERLVSNFHQMRDSHMTSAVLLYNGFYLNQAKDFEYHSKFDVFGSNSEMAISAVQEVIGEDCGKYSGNLSNTLVSCVFEDSEYLQDNCGSSGSLGVARGLWLKPNSDKSTNDSWTAVGEWHGRNQKLPAYNFFASTSVSGTSPNDYTAYGAFQNRNVMNKVPGLAKYEIDYTTRFEGYTLLIAEGGGAFAKLPFYPGMGPALFVNHWKDPFSSPVIDAHFLIEVEEDEEEPVKPKDRISPKIAIDSTHFSDAPYEAKKEKHCSSKGDIEAFDESYTLDSVSGDWIVIDTVTYNYGPTDVIKKSNLMRTIGKSCAKESGLVGIQCKIATDLSDCNHCWSWLEPDNPADPNTTYHKEHDCNNLIYDSDGKIKDGRKDELLKCINRHAQEEGGLIVRHHTQPLGEMKVAGMGILENAWLAKNMFTTDDICYPNQGIVLESESRLVDVNIDCAGAGGSVCAGNLLNNGGFEEGTRVPPQTQKPEWGSVPVYWYPHWYSGDKYGLGVKSPEYRTGIAEDRPGKGSISFAFSPSGSQQFDAGLFQEIRVGDEDGNPTSIPAGSTIKLYGYFAGNNGYSGSNGRPDYRVTRTFKLELGLKMGKSVDELAGSFPNGQKIENFQFPVNGSTDFGSYVDYSVTGDHENYDLSKAPEFIKISGEYVTKSSTEYISVFLRGYNTDKDDGDVLQAFFDHVCLTVTSPDGRIFTNISEEEISQPIVSPTGGGGGHCQPSPDARSCDIKDPDVHTYAQNKVKNYFPWIGTATEILYLSSTKDYATFRESLSECPADGPITEPCICREGQTDWFTAYLYREDAFEGGWARKVKASLKETEGWGEIDDGDDDDDDETPPRSTPYFDETFVELLKEVEKQVKNKTGQCIPWEMIAAIMANEGVTGYTANQLNNHYYRENNSICSNINISCSSSGQNTGPDKVYTPEDDLQAYNDIRRYYDSEPGCGSYASLPEGKCKTARTYVEPNTGNVVSHVCCDVRGPMQFRATTWHPAYQNSSILASISKDILEDYGEDISDYSPMRTRLIDAVVAAALMLKDDCSLWEGSSEENTVRKHASLYWSGSTSHMNSNYANNVWDAYQDYKYGYSEGPSVEPPTGEIVPPPQMGIKEDIRSNLPSDALTISIHAQCSTYSLPICQVYPYNMRWTFGRLTPGVTTQNVSDNNFAGSIRIPKGTTSTCDMFGPFTESDGFLQCSGDGRWGHGACNTMAMVNQVFNEFGIEAGACHGENYVDYTMPGIMNKYRVSVSCIEDRSSVNYGSNMCNTENTTWFTYDSDSPLVLHWQVVGDSMSLWLEYYDK